MINSKLTLKTLFLSCFISISGCNSDENEINIPPAIDGSSSTAVIVHTDDNSLIKRVSMTVDASDIDGSIVAYKWNLLSEQNFQLNGKETATIDYEFPMVNSEEQNLLIIEATVTDNNDAQTSEIYEEDINDYIFVQVSDIEINAGAEGKLSASVYGRESNISTLLWTVDSEHELTLLDAETETVSFVAPDVNEVTEITLKLTVTDVDNIISHSLGVVKIQPL
jgi:hypothetical protein